MKKRDAKASIKDSLKFEYGENLEFEYLNMGENSKHAMVSTMSTCADSSRGVLFDKDEMQNQSV